MRSPERALPDPLAMERRRKKAARLQGLRSRERLNAMMRAGAYRHLLAKAQSAMQAHLAEHAEQQRLEELQQVQDQVRQQLQGLGQAQADALAFMEQRVAHAQQQQQLQAHLAAAQQARSHAALARAREEATARTARVDMYKAQREAILAAEREKAKAMAEELRVKAQQVCFAQRAAEGCR